MPNDDSGDTGERKWIRNKEQDEQGVWSVDYVRMRRMKAAVNVLWILLSLLGALALAHVTGAINPTEKVNGLWLVVAAGCIYVLAYRFYGRWLARQVVERCG